MSEIRPKPYGGPVHPMEWELELRYAVARPFLWLIERLFPSLAAPLSDGNENKGG